MLIGIDASQAAKERKTGVENFCFDLIFNLLKFDKHNRYILYSDAPVQFSQKFHNVKILATPATRFWHNLKLPKMIKETKPDVFISPGYMIPQVSNVSMVSIIHDFAPRYFPRAYTSKDKFLQKLAINRAVAKAKAILFVSKNTMHDFNKFYPRYKGMSAVIYQGINTVFSTANNKTSYRPTKYPYILSVGRLEERKNIKNLVKAYGILRTEYPDIRQKLILSGKRGFRYNEIKHEIDRLGEYSKDVILPGFVPSDDIYSLYSNADVFIFPSLYEGFGLPLLEAFSARVPVACSDNSSLPEVAEDGAEYFNPQSPDQIARSIHKILSDSHRAKSLVEKSLKRLDFFTWEKTVRDVLKILNKVVHEK